MAISFKIDRNGRRYVAGISKEFAKYERDIISGKIPCPFKVNTKIQMGNGSTLTINKPVPLNPNGKPK